MIACLLSIAQVQSEDPNVAETKPAKMTFSQAFRMKENAELYLSMFRLEGEIQLVKDALRSKETVLKAADAELFTNLCVEFEQVRMDIENNPITTNYQLGFEESEFETITAYADQLAILKNKITTLRKKYSIFTQAEIKENKTWFRMKCVFLTSAVIGLAAGTGFGEWWKAELSRGLVQNANRQKKI